ncbi:N2227-domain-containing protein [Vararia minispora EC-137]|uniref:N2227-domain-containing protein n=1 Tax=Vararia minispora EC-137 TaxID=1314806 RepID=A0ACB8QPH0_9AGAM|nr:N2227-domain-containing protein [Vararia minispora EC-137]
MREDDVDEEEAHFINVITTFQKYGPYTLAGNNRRRKDLYALPLRDQELLASLGYKEKLAKTDEAILANAEFLKKIVASPGIFGDEGDDAEDGENNGDDGDGQRRTNPHTHSHDSQTHLHGRSSQTHSHDTQNIRREHAHAHSREHTHSHRGHGHGHEGGHEHEHRSPRGKYKPSEFDMDKLRSTLKQFVRDWSEEGLEEREASYKPLKDALVAHFRDIPAEQRHNFRVLVPGAGLGRLAYDVAKLGFSCQGNEFSHYMLLSSFFILNRTQEAYEHTIYPYVHSFSNVPNKQAMLRPIKFPDVRPSDLPPNANFSLVAGDFEEIYGTDEEKDPGDPSAGQFDAILTCFFIDTAKNIVNYLRVIHKILVPGGVWINIGPLLWHFENNTSNETSIELDLEEVKELARKIGFEIKDERTIDTTYVNNKEGMLGYIYHAAFWTATKQI